MSSRRFVVWFALLGGIALFAAGTSQALAQTGGSDEAPTYAVWFQLMFGLVLALIGAYAKGIDRRVDAIEETSSEQQRSIHTLNVLLAGGYHTKGEIAQMHADLRGMISAVHSRMDRAGYPPQSRANFMTSESP
jgi:uncharacterized coiled-coil protein SlyX